MTKGERIKRLRNTMGFSQTEFADRIGVSKQTLYKYENDIITNIPSDKVEAIAKECHSSPGYVMGWDDAVPTSGHQTGYYNPETATAAQEMLDDPDLHALMDAARDARPEYVKSAIQLLKTLKETNPDG